MTGRDITGQKFGQLTALSLIIGVGRRFWNCGCSCGKAATIRQDHLMSGNTKSCGCLAPKHGGCARRRKHPLYYIWNAMRGRCINRNCAAFRYYGGRGIRVCDQWNSFACFVADMRPRPPGTTLDRRDNNGDYTPQNCRWATHAEQMGNRRPLGLKIAGMKFGKLTAIQIAGKDGKTGLNLWLFECECGRRVTKIASRVKSGSTQSCGCLARENSARIENLRRGREILLNRRRANRLE